MSKDRTEVTLGPGPGKKTFKDLPQVRDWLTAIRTQN